MTVIPTRDQVPQIVRVPGPASPPRPAPAGAPGMTGQDFLRIIRKRKWLIILSLIICLSAALTVTKLWLMFSPLYTASAYLAVNAPERPLEIGLTSPSGEVIDRLKMSLAAMAKGDIVFQSTLDDPSVKKTTWYVSHIQDAVEKLDDAVDVTPIRETDLLRFSMTGRDRRECAEIVTAWAKAFVKDAADMANSDRINQFTQIGNQQRDLKAQLDSAEREIRQLKDSDERVITQKLALRTGEIQGLATELMKADLERKTAEEQKKNIDNMKASGTLDQHPMVSGMVDQDPTLRNLVNDLVSQRTMYEQLKDRFPDDHRAVREVKSRIDSLTRQVQDRENIVRKSASEALEDSYTRQLAVVTATSVAIQTRIDEARADATVLANDLKTVIDLTARRKNLAENIDLMEHRLLELRLLEKSSRPVYMRREATAPKDPSIPRWSLNIAVGFFLGLVVGMGLAFLLEIMDTSIKSPTDVSRRVDLPMLGMVPHVDDIDEEIEDLRLAFMTNPRSLVGESFRQIRTTLQFSAPASQLRTLMVTSAMPGDGRTTISLNLAAATAHGGRKVLVVEANFRQPMIRSLFPQAPEAGLSNILVGQAHWKDVVCEVHPNLFVMTGGPMPPNPAELLGSDAMRSLIVELSSEFDQVIFDGAPCVLVTDPAVLGTLVDGVVLVVRAAANTYGVVQRARDLLSRVGARMFGVVLNGIRVTAGGYLRKNYRTYYEYHEQGTGAPYNQLPKKTA